jgi:hypothetical protein
MAFAKSQYEDSSESVELKWGDGDFGFPISDQTIIKAPPRLKHIYMLYIDLDASNSIIVRKFQLRDFVGTLQENEKKLLKKAIDPNVKPDWPDLANGGDLNSCIFQGTNRFIIVLGNKKWKFYNYEADGHKGITFLPQKVIYEKDNQGNTIKTMRPGSFNTSFSNGKPDTIDGYNCYRTDNFILDEEGAPLNDGDKRPILFDINVEIPVANSAKTALITIDPGGQNLGPH